MRHHRDDVVRHALRVLDDYGLADLTMRRLAGELGVTPGALYHHVSDKQTLLGLVADEILTRGARPAGVGAWDEQVARRCTALREAVLSYRDGAEVVSTARAFGLGAATPQRELRASLLAAGLDDDLAATAARTLVHYVLAHAGDEQQHLQADGVGALGPGARPREASDFEAGLELVLDGVRLRVAAAQAARR